MATYLLLRNNKEQGPFSLDQLVELGFKPYDLVWVEGKSAAWRYPGEIAELQPYAPAVEDQPFDRFFKKPEPEKQTEKEEMKPEPEPVKQKTIPEIKAEVKETLIAVPETKTVFVSLPAGQTPTVKKEIPVLKKQVAEETNSAYMPKPVDATIPEPEPVLETKYSQSLDEIKDLYRQNLLSRKRRTEQLKILREWGPRAAVIMIVLLLGIFLGRKFSNSSSEAAPAVTGKVVIPSPPLVDEPVTNNEAESATPASVLPPEADSILQQEQVMNEPKPLNLDLNTGRTTPPVSVNTPKKETRPVIKEKAIVMTESKVINVPADNPPGERTKTTRSVKTPGLTREDVLKKISVSANQYKQGAFGGVKNLELTVTNHSSYTLDNVTVEVQYLKPSEEVLKSEMIYFSSVAPNGTLTVKVPDSSRGVKLSYRISNVISRQLDADLGGLGF